MVACTAAWSLVMSIDGPVSSIRLAGGGALMLRIADSGSTMNAPPAGSAGVDCSSPETRTRSAGRPCCAMMVLPRRPPSKAAACGDASTGMAPWPCGLASRAGLTGEKPSRRRDQGRVAGRVDGDGGYHLRRC